MKRDLPTLANTIFDLLVVGSGIYGATVAWDAAQRGLSVALIDRGDFGGGTSANSAKTVHGGIRALQTGQLGELRSFVRERRALCRIAPHLVHRLPFVIPTYQGFTRHRLTMQAAFSLYDLLSRDRNTLPDNSKHLPPSQAISRAECLELNPLIQPDGVNGGILWYDCQMYNADRVVLAFVQSAAGSGATVANHVEVTGWLLDDNQISGVKVQDLDSANAFDIRAKLTINATGPGSSALTSTLPTSLPTGSAPYLSKAMNLVTRSITLKHALGGLTDSRYLFALPWRGVSIIGTSHDGTNELRQTTAPKEADIEAFLKQIKRAFPGASLCMGDIQLVHAGLLPATGPSGKKLLKTSLIRDHRADGLQGLLSVVGVRYTTARRTAEMVVDQVFSLLGHHPPPCRTAVTPLAGGDINVDFDHFLKTTLSNPSRLGASTLRRLALSYGSRHQSVLRLMETDPTLTTPLSEASSITRGEILYGIRQEMAIRLSDAVLRRTEAGSAGHPGKAALYAASEIMAAELDWSVSHQAREIEEVERSYYWSY